MHSGLKTNMMCDVCSLRIFFSKRCMYMWLFVHLLQVLAVIRVWKETSVAGAISASFAMIMIYVQHAMRQELQLPVIRRNIQCSASLQGLISVRMIVTYTYHDFRSIVCTCFILIQCLLPSVTFHCLQSTENVVQIMIFFLEGTTFTAIFSPEKLVMWLKYVMFLLLLICSVVFSCKLMICTHISKCVFF
jgi:hypothetical protein